MTGGWFDSLVNRVLLLLVGVVVASALLVSFFNMASSRQELEAQARNQVTMVADLVTRELDRKLIERFQVLTESATLMVEDDALANDAQAVIESQLPVYHLFDQLFLIDARGLLRATYPEQPAIVGTDVSQRSYFLSTSSQLTPQISEPFQSYHLDRPVVMMTAPLFNPTGRFTGVMGASIVLSSDNFLQEVATVRLGKRGTVEVASRAGITLVHPDASRQMQAVDRDNPAIVRAMAGEEPVMLVENSRSGPSLVAIRQLNMAPWYIRVSWPLDDAYAPAARLLDDLLAVTLIIILLVIPGAMLLFRRQMKPLLVLGEQIRERHLGVRQDAIDVRGGREIREVSDTFNQVMQSQNEVEARLRVQQQRADSILGALQEGVILTDTRGVIRHTNPAAEAFLGEADSVVGVMLFDLAEFEKDGERWGLTEFLAHEEISGLDGQLRNDHHQSFDVEITLLRLEQGLADERLVFVIRDDSERRQQEVLLSWQATHDALTGLVNRRAFSASLVKWLGEAPALTTPSVLMLIDLDHFKPVNDLGGHLLGDELLKALADVLRDAVRQSDVVCRMGGDEFAILLPACGLARAQVLAENVRAGVEAVVLQKDGRDFRVTASVGLTTLSPEDAGPREVVARADEGAYAAKAQGRNQVVAVPAPDH